MAQLLAAPFSYFTDNNGLPLSGGKIFTYAAGTVTPKATYTTSAGTTPLSNPVILNSSGMATIWLVGAYKIVLQTSAGVTIATTDNVTSSTATGDMTAAIYDPANIQQQLVGISAVQMLSNKSLVGITNGSDASVGVIGEYLSTPTAASVALSNGLASTITSLSLTAGDWDVHGNVVFTQNTTTTATAFFAGISTTNNTFDALPEGYTNINGQSAAGLSPVIPTNIRRYSFTAPTTVYLIGQASFAISTLSSYGFIGARRVR